MAEEKPSFSAPVFAPTTSLKVTQTAYDDSVAAGKSFRSMLFFIKQFLLTGMPISAPKIVLDSILSKKDVFFNNSNYKATGFYKILLQIKYEILRQPPKQLILFALRWESFLDTIISGLEETEPQIPEYYNEFYIPLEIGSEPINPESFSDSFLEKSNAEESYSLNGFFSSEENNDIAIYTSDEIKSYNCSSIINFDSFAGTP